MSLDRHRRLRVEVMGEAARYVPPEVRARYPEVAWRLMNDMRNVLIHAYTRVDLEAVWDAVAHDVVPTREHLVRILEQAEGTDET